MFDYLFFSLGTVGQGKRNERRVLLKRVISRLIHKSAFYRT